MVRLILAVVLAVTALTVATPADASPVAAAGSKSDPFYEPPTPLPDGKPGDVIRAEPVLVPVTTPPVRAWRIMYLSTGAKGTPIAVTGTLMVPLTPWTGAGSRPIVSFAVGTRGVADKCAPSMSLRSGVDYELTSFPHALLRNWALVISDMEGLGTPGLHTYVLKTTAKQILDALRAAPKVKEAGLQADAPVAVWGYSQGGHSAAHAAETAPTYAPELNLKGVAAGAVPADLQKTARFIDGSPLAFAEFLVAASYHSAYPELPWDELITAQGRDFMAAVERTCLALDGVALAGFKRLRDYLNPDPLLTPEWIKRLKENSAGQSTPTAPMFLYHSPADTAIPYDQGKDLFRTYCQGGVKAQWAPIPVPTHLGALIAGAPLAVAWLADRFAGKPAPSSC